MLLKRKTSSIGSLGGSDFPDSNGQSKTTIVKKLVTVRKGLSVTNTTTTTRNDDVASSSGCPKPSLGPKIMVQRVPFFAGGGMSTTVLDKKFQRPCLKRRSYGKQADVALQQCSLGQKRRTDGMARILARAGRPLSFKLPHRSTMGNDNNKSDNSDDEEDDNEKENDKPFEPLEVWKSPHQNGKLIGLPSQM
jgi:hypothetical protein